MKTKLELLKENFIFPQSLIVYRDYYNFYNEKTKELMLKIAEPCPTLSDIQINSYKKEIEKCIDSRDAMQSNIQEILTKLANLDISEQAYERFCDLNEASRDFRRYDTISPGCDCGCGGETLTLQDIVDHENSCRVQMIQIEKELNHLL